MQGGAQGRQLCLGSVGMERETVVREGVGMFEREFLKGDSLPRCQGRAKAGRCV